jgi:hypothetical protein
VPQLLEWFKVNKQIIVIQHPLEKNNKMFLYRFALDEWLIVITLFLLLGFCELFVMLVLLHDGTIGIYYTLVYIFTRCTNMIKECVSDKHTCTVEEDILDYQYKQSHEQDTQNKEPDTAITTNIKSMDMALAVPTQDNYSALLSNKKRERKKVYHYKTNKKQPHQEYQCLPHDLVSVILSFVPCMNFDADTLIKNPMIILGKFPGESLPRAIVPIVVEDSLDKFAQLIQLFGHLPNKYQLILLQDCHTFEKGYSKYRQTNLPLEGSWELNLYLSRGNISVLHALEAHPQFFTMKHALTLHLGLSIEENTDWNLDLSLFTNNAISLYTPHLKVCWVECYSPIQAKESSLVSTLVKRADDYIVLDCRYRENMDILYQASHCQEMYIENPDIGQLQEYFSSRQFASLSKIRHLDIENTNNEQVKEAFSFLPFYCGSTEDKSNGNIFQCIVSALRMNRHVATVSLRNFHTNDLLNTLDASVFARLCFLQLMNCSISEDCRIVFIKAGVCAYFENIYEGGNECKERIHLSSALIDAMTSTRTYIYIDKPLQYDSLDDMIQVCSLPHLKRATICVSGESKTTDYDTVRNILENIHALYSLRPIVSVTYQGNENVLSNVSILVKSIEDLLKNDKNNKRIELPIRFVWK